MGFFSKRKIQGDELLNYLDFLGEEWKFRAFQEKEASAYTDALTRFDPKAAAKNADAYAELAGAASRLAQSAAELIRRKDALKTVPDKATSCYFAWHAAYTDYLAWALAQADTIEDKMAGNPTDAAALKDLQQKSEQSRAEAETEEQKLLKQLDLSQADIEQLHDRATQAAAQDTWRPRVITRKPKR
ncbi:hypothetical protein [Dehalogenimonas alkenigignens]|uniref:Uncharacterized protein n=1 Tax=Dehalogenimonas alkenigignens TaxID=1217799 RepID=A0A0W0GJD8_9CHLR|nr:hypothetical protein [Dehalogenimonas alkenigignens]KTB48688.1 hypothetical protein DEALK_15350 [Dehalogenimonas alkenigignens]